MISYTRSDVERMRSDTQTPRTESCPQCDASIEVSHGISVPHLCGGCQNLWQPFQLFSRYSTLWIEPDGTTDLIAPWLLTPLTNKG